MPIEMIGSFTRWNEQFPLQKSVDASKKNGWFVIMNTISKKLYSKLFLINYNFSKVKFMSSLKNFAQF
jgi:hypothetical protein